MRLELDENVWYIWYVLLFYFMMVVFRKRVWGIFFDFDNMFVLILKVNLYVFYKVKDKLFEFFVEKDVENIVLKY